MGGECDFSSVLGVASRYKGQIVYCCVPCAFDECGGKRDVARFKSAYCLTEGECDTKLIILRRCSSCNLNGGWCVVYIDDIDGDNDGSGVGATIRGGDRHLVVVLGFVVECRLGFQLTGCGINIKGCSIGVSAETVGQSIYIRIVRVNIGIAISGIRVVHCYRVADVYTCRCVFCYIAGVGICRECWCLVYVFNSDGNINGGGEDTIGNFNHDFIDGLSFKI